jgi:hypothetical protein
MSTAISSVLVLGASGGFGTLFSQVLAKDGITVRGISRKGNPRADATFTDYLSADPTNPNEEVRSVAFSHVKLEHWLTRKAGPGARSNSQRNRCLCAAWAMRPSIGGLNAHTFTSMYVLSFSEIPMLSISPSETTVFETGHALPHVEFLHSEFRI